MWSLLCLEHMFPQTRELLEELLHQPKSVGKEAD